MKLKNLYKEVIKKGIEADIRGHKEIEKSLKKAKKSYEKLDKKEKKIF